MLCNTNSPKILIKLRKWHAITAWSWLFNIIILLNTSLLYCCDQHLRFWGQRGVTSLLSPNVLGPLFLVNTLLKWECHEIFEIWGFWYFWYLMFLIFLIFLRFCFFINPTHLHGLLIETCWQEILIRIKLRKCWLRDFRQSSLMKKVKENIGLVVLWSSPMNLFLNARRGLQRQILCQQHSVWC